MALNFTLPLRVVQVILAIIVLGLTAYVTNWWSHYWHAFSPSEINFLLFSSIWTTLVLVYLIVAPLSFPNAAHKFAVLGVEAVTMIFWFAGFIALAVFLSDRVCFGNVCNAAKAATVFAAFEWALFAATTVLAALHVFRTQGTRNPAPDQNMKINPTTV